MVLTRGAPDIHRMCSVGNLVSDGYRVAPDICQNVFGWSWISSVLIQNVETVVLEMDPGSVLIHVDVVFALLEPCPVLTKRALDIRRNVVCLCLDLE